MYGFDSFTDVEYLQIQLANEAGLDKETYQTRLEWANDETRESVTTPLGVKTEIALKKALKKEKHGCPVYFDAIASGIQILSAVSSCRKGCEATGLINTGARPNPYQLVTDKMDMVGEYESIKKAVMTYFYGSKKVPREVFGDRIHEFERTCMETFPNAYSMINFLINTWDDDAYAHSWTMPDGFQVYIPVLQKELFTVHLDGYEPMNVIGTVNKPKKGGLANAANITHSIDGYVMRSLIRHCSYDPFTIQTSLKKVERELSKRTDSVDVSYVDITRKDYETMSTGELMGLYIDMNLMLSNKPFDVITVHDNFGCHPKHMNLLRYWYNQIMSRLSASNILNDIVSQLYGEEIELVFDENSKSNSKDNVAGEILNSNYAIC